MKVGVLIEFTSDTDIDAKFAALQTELIALVA